MEKKTTKEDLYYECTLIKNLRSRRYRSELRLKSNTKRLAKAINFFLVFVFFIIPKKPCIRGKQNCNLTPQIETIGSVRQK